eukprot:EG_transcript_8701
MPLGKVLKVLLGPFRSDPCDIDCDFKDLTQQVLSPTTRRRTSNRFLLRPMTPPGRTARCKRIAPAAPACTPAPGLPVGPPPPLPPPPCVVDPQPQPTSPTPSQTGDDSRGNRSPRISSSPSLPSSFASTIVMNAPPEEISCPRSDSQDTVVEECLAQLTRNTRRGSPACPPSAVTEKAPRRPERRKGPSPLSALAGWEHAVAQCVPPPSVQGDWPVCVF